MAVADGPGVVLFCSSSLVSEEVEPDFASEQAAAVAAGYQTALVDHDELSTGSAVRGVSRVWSSEPGSCALYRGWMMPVERYEAFYRALQARQVTLVNTPVAYRACHWLPESYNLIAPWTPETLWIPMADLAREGQVDWDKVVSAAATFGAHGLVVKDYVKSQKHHWLEACFVPHADDADAVRRVVSRFLELQGDDLTGGIVLRRHIQLRQVGVHPQSGMPLSEEYRIFYFDGRPFFTAPYWDVTAGELDELPMGDFDPVAQTIPTRFFSMDVARGTDGRWWIIELGDGQVAGLPPRADPARFYSAMLESFERRPREWS